MSEVTDPVEQKVTGKIFRVIAMLASAFLLFIIIKWTFDLVERDIGDLPVLNSLNPEIRKKPSDAGGKVTEYSHLSINNLIGGAEEINNETVMDKIRLAPITDELSALEKNTPIFIGDEQQSEDELAKTITNALARVLGEKNIPEIEKIYLLQLGSYVQASDAVDKMELIKDQNIDLLSNFKAEVVAASFNGTLTHRLRLRGFSSLSEAHQICAALDARNENCIVLAEEGAK